MTKKTTALEDAFDQAKKDNALLREALAGPPTTDINEDMAAELKALRADIQPLLADNNRLRAALAAREWQDIATAPRDGSEVLLYRPLAQKSGDPIVTLRKTTPYESHVWEATIPPGCDGKNFTEGACYATHWQPLPDAPVAVP